MSSSHISVLACILLGVASSCAGGAPVTCDAAIDCDVREECRAGVCVDEGSEGEGEGEEGEGEGEGESGERAIIAGACTQLIACGLASPPLDTCVDDNEAAVTSLRDRGNFTCSDAATALLATMTCAAEQSCDVLADTNDGGLFAQACPSFVEFRALLSECEGGEGEGEGEPPPPPPPPDGCVGQAAFAPAQIADTIIAAVGTSGETAAPVCGPSEQAVRLLLNVSGNLEAIDGGFSSIDGMTAVDLVDIVADPPAREVRATACLDQNFVEGPVAVALLVDGLLTNSVCGFVQGF